MKKYISLLLAGVMAMALVACGGQTEPEPRRFELSDVQMLADAGVFSEELEELAEKAKFSQYTLTVAEIDIFRNRITQLREVLRSKNWFRRLVLKLVFALE